MAVEAYLKGFKHAGFLPVLGIDIDKYAIATYERHNTGRGWATDITNINGKDITKRSGYKIIDVMTGGPPPCQAFSSVAIAKWRSLGIPIATLEKICNGFWIPENIRFTVNVDARVLQKV